jgi:hypothetical protein
MGAIENGIEELVDETYEVLLLDKTDAIGCWGVSAAFVEGCDASLTCMA